MIPRYQSTGMKELWSDERKYQTWFLVERTYLECYLRHQQAFDSELIERLKQAFDRIDWHQFAKRVFHYEQEVKHDVIAFLHALEDEIGADARLIHIGLTSSDIVDTSFAFLLKTAAEKIKNNLQAVIKALWQQALAQRAVLCLGRTHGQPAEPTTFGLKLLGHLCELLRGYERLKHATDEISVGKFSGAVGVYAHAHPDIEANALRALDLKPETVATQVVARDRHASFFATLAVLAGSIERLVVEIRLLMHGQVKEVFEPFSARQKGSSAMPHKKNPVLSENLTGLMRMVRSYAMAAMENQALWHERDISHSSVERIIGPDATSIMEFALVRLTGLISALVVDKAQMAKHLSDAGDSLSSQSLMLALINQGLARREAYEIVQKAALSAGVNRLTDELLAAGHQALLTREACENIIENSRRVVHEDLLFERVKNLLDASF